MTGVTIQCGSPDAINAYTATLAGHQRHQWLLDVELYNVNAEMRSLEGQMAHIRGTIEYLKGTAS